MIWRIRTVSEGSERTEDRKEIESGDDGPYEIKREKEREKTQTVLGVTKNSGEFGVRGGEGPLYPRMKSASSENRDFKKL